MDSRSKALVLPDLPSQHTTSRLRMRKGTYGFSGISRIKLSEKVSQFLSDQRRPPLTHLPTYQLGPYIRFDPEQVKKCANELLDEHFTNHKYDVQQSPQLAMDLSLNLMRACKALKFNRYRIIAVVTLGQKRAQSYNNAVAFLWDHERDNFVNLQRQVPTAFIQVTIFGVYLD